MISTHISSGKRKRLRAISTPEGIIAALAIDQRKSLRQMIAAAGGNRPEAISDWQLSEVKRAVTKILTPGASAVLLDPEYGLDAAPERAPGCGLLMTYEADGYENPRPYRMLALMPGLSVRRLRDLGADAVKILLSYAPDDNNAVNDEKCAWIERIGSECESLDMPFLLEPVVYDPAGLDPKSLEFSKRKPRAVLKVMSEFSKPQYKVDVLKVEFPVVAAFVEGSTVYAGQRAYSMREAIDWYREVDAAAERPYVYLSAGISSSEFVASLGMAADASARFSGVLCGRAHWQGGIAEYASGGSDALLRWLESDGLRNMNAVNECLRAAVSWERWFQPADAEAHAGGALA
jgi:tagatose 1,6-diphosphate aldolase